MHLAEDIQACRACETRFRATATAHEPRPVTWFRPEARILISGQAPGLRVHRSGRPFTDPSGDRLRAWMGVDEATFYDQSRIAIVPMAFCFPGYNEKGADLPPPTQCAARWRQRVLDALPQVALTLLVGGAAQRWHLGKGRVTETVAAWREHGPEIIPLPHPSWRNNAWLAQHHWFEAELLPVLRRRIQALL